MIRCCVFLFLLLTLLQGIWLLRLRGRHNLEYPPQYGAEGLQRDRPLLQPKAPYLSEQPQYTSNENKQKGMWVCQYHNYSFSKFILFCLRSLDVG